MKYVIAALAFCLLAACAHGEAANSAAAGSASAAPLFYPPGVLPPGDWQAQTRDGIYSADTAAQCCFLAGRSLLTLDVAPNAQLAVFKFFVPSVKPFLAGKERVTLALNGIPAGTPADLTPGIHDVIFTIPASLRGKRRLAASLAMSVVWVPKRIGLNADERELSVMLLRVGYI
jgi:hypothetical protein